MSRYQVWSTHVGVEKDDEPHDVLETTRTDPKTAQEDAALFREVFHRKAWVNEVK